MKKKRKPTAKKILAQQQATVSALLNAAFHHLGETSLPFVVLIGGKIFTNTDKLHAHAIVQRTATFIAKCDDLEIERQAEGETGFGASDGDIPG